MKRQSLGIRYKNISETKSFKEIQRLIKNAICEKTNLSWNESIKKIENGWNVDLRKDKDLMVLIENQLVKQIKLVFPDLKQESLQFPANIRLIGKKEPVGYLEKPYATDYLHSDIWSGAPRDCRNYFMYVYIKNDGSYLKLFEQNENVNIEKIARKYKNQVICEKELTEYDLPPKDGIFCTFDPWCLHKTIRTNSGVRISIDFRTRRQCCYTVDNKYILEKEFLKVETGNPFGLGHYWTFSPIDFKVYKEKVEYELKQASKLSFKASKLRTKYLESL